MKEVKKYMEDKYVWLMRNYYYILLKQSFTIHKECTGSLRDMEYDDVIIHSVNLNTLMNVTRILNELIEMIEEGKFNTSENSVSCCGGECGKQ